MYVGYSRWSIERCFEEDKDELGFDHFEVRGWKAIHRHMYLTQVSHLYLNKAREKLVAEEGAQEKAGFFPTGRPNQIREAVAAWFQAAALPRSARKPILEKAAWIISYERNHNATALFFHRKKTLRNLHRRGLTLGRMRTCVGSNFAL